MQSKAADNAILRFGSACRKTLCQPGGIMDYDFKFEKAKNASLVSFPCQFGEFEVEARTFPWEIFREYLLENGARENLGKNSLIWQIEDHGTIFITGTDSCVHLDIDTQWQPLSSLFVLSLFVWLREQGDPNVVLADTNERMYYDPVSFQRLMKLSGS